jgi:hypothetical protein
VAAVAAAERMAKSHGMTLQEAAGGGPAPPRPEAEPRRPRGSGPSRAREVARAAQMMDGWIHTDKARRDAAVAAAQARGLDAEERRRAAAEANRVIRRNDRRRDPVSHARVLLGETSLPLEEICNLTGLDIYEVVGMKLKMRGPDRVR